MAPNSPAPGVTPPFSAAVLDLILGFEGVDQPGSWPGGDSSITVGHSYDLTAETADELRRDWALFLGKTNVERLVDGFAPRRPGRAGVAHL